MAWLRKALVSTRAACFGKVGGTLLALLLLAAYPAQAEQRVNINTADAQTIASVLNGVGLKKAEAIVSYREANGRFDAPADLTKVKGIGPGILARNEGRIAIDGAAASDGSSTATATTDESP